MKRPQVFIESVIIMSPHRKQLAWKSQAFHSVSYVRPFHIHHTLQWGRIYMTYLPMCRCCIQGFIIIWLDPLANIYQHNSKYHIPWFLNQSISLNFEKRCILLRSQMSNNLTEDLLSLYQMSSTVRN